MNTKFIVLEGIDGAGTTTQAAKLVDRMNDANFKCFPTAEPSPSAVGILIRSILDRKITLKDSEYSEISQQSFALLCAADRIMHTNNVIRPMLKNGSHVICDRYTPSSYAYQGVDVSTDWIKTLNKFDLAPDLIIYLRIDADVALDRITKRSNKKDIFEKKEFLSKVGKLYDEFFSLVKSPVLTIDGTKSVTEISDIIWEELNL